MKLEHITATILGISSTIALTSLALSYMAFRKSKVSARAEVFISLRGRFLEVHDDLPETFHDPNWRVQEGSSEWKALERYWLNAFDEWYVTTRILKVDHGVLWDGFYSHAIMSSLRHASMRKVLLHMFDGRVSFGSFKDEFEKEIDGLWSSMKPEQRTLRESLTSQWS